MARWLVKSEPFKYSWDQLVKDGQTTWDGVRNNQAAIYLRSMKIGDELFFYHSNEAWPSSASPRWWASISSIPAIRKPVSRPC